jgi:alpha-1,3-glucosyltransferase
MSRARMEEFLSREVSRHKPGDPPLEKKEIIIMLVSIAIMLRAIIALWGYSGAGKPPMYGDFEAQRHWMEVTIGLPIGDWYRNTTSNDLQYWGLDYPPLTAYASWIVGKVFEIIYPPLVEWETSRGHESADGKSYMRISVIILDCLIYIPSVFLIYSKIIRENQFKSPKTEKPSGIRSQNYDIYEVHGHCDIMETECKEVDEITEEVKKELLAISKAKTDLEMKHIVPRIVHLLQLLVLLILPGLILIDHGHFQYNGVCLGFSLFACYFLLEDQYLLTSFFFCLSLNFKQIALYYSFIFFFILLRKCLLEERKNPLNGIRKLIMIGSTVIVTFAVLWLPFCIYHNSQEETCLSSLGHVLSRQFPFNRGIFEDKVANLWYVGSRMIDFRKFLTTPQMLTSALILTLLMVAPVAVNVFIKKTTSTRLHLSLFCCSLAFFLASFQVSPALFVFSFHFNYHFLCCQLSFLLSWNRFMRNLFSLQ